MTTERWSLQVTPHAIDRYMERINPGASRRDAEQALQEAARGAKRLHKQAHDRALYAVQDNGSEFRIVIRQSKGKAPAILTVLFNTEVDEISPENPEGHFRQDPAPAPVARLVPRPSSLDPVPSTLDPAPTRLAELEASERVHARNAEEARDVRRRLRHEVMGLRILLAECMLHVSGPLRDRVRAAVEARTAPEVAGE